MLNRRLTALVIGISNYANTNFTLKNPVNDAQGISEKLTELGFSVTTLTDATVEKIDTAIDTFLDNLNSNDVGLFFFAGHGFEIEGQNFLAAVDTDLRCLGSVKHHSCSLSQLIEGMSRCSNSTNLIILDACRNNPFITNRSGSSGRSTFSHLQVPKGTLIAYSTSPGQTSLDGAGDNGPYTESLIRHITTPDITIEEVFRRTRNTLSTITADQQTSWEHTSLTSEFMFRVSVFNTIPETLYSKDALADKNYLLPKNSEFSTIINGLKSYNFYKQNDEIRKINIEILNSFSNNELFVLGRNIYQSAVGGADDSNEFIERFREKTDSLDPSKKKQLLDGILFEIFFDSSGNLRDNFKSSKLNLVFTLRLFNEFTSSFDFIADILSNYPNRFYQFPGRQNPINLDIILHSTQSEESVIDEIRLQGNNILKLESNVTQNNEYYPTNRRKLMNLLSKELVMPLDLITINLIPKPHDENKLLYPSNHTILKK